MKNVQEFFRLSLVSGMCVAFVFSLNNRSCSNSAKATTDKNKAGIEKLEVKKDMIVKQVKEGNVR